MPFRNIGELTQHRDAVSSLLESPCLTRFLKDRFNISA
jgi:hypothetical protein